MPTEKTSCKPDYRKKYLSRRDNIPPESRIRKSEEIVKHLLTYPDFDRARNVHLFVSYKSEVDTREIIEFAWRSEKTVIMPRVVRNSGSLTNHVTRSWDDLEPGFMGIPEPKADLPQVPAEEFDLVLVPGCAFDRFGGRMGYGGGYYDRFLSVTDARRVALSFSEQMVEAVPYCNYDLPVHVVVTEDGILECDYENRPPCFVKERYPHRCPEVP